MMGSAPRASCRWPSQAFVYLAGLQLLLTSGRRSLLLGGCAALAGLAYQANFLGIKRVRVRGPGRAGPGGGGVRTTRPTSWASSGSG